jgi:signal recognition particle subunit SRP54
VILDTAGRLQIDEPLMNELAQVQARTQPDEVFLVVDSMVGQDAVNSAKVFNEKLPITGVILTKLDGDSRGGAALSVKHVTGKPIKFVGVGEKLGALEEFHPERMAGRILQQGDIVSLVEKAQETFDVEATKKLEKKVRKEGMDLNDFLAAMKQIQKLGPLEGVLKMLPGVNTKILKQANTDPKRIKWVEAIVLSMTNEERRKPDVLNGSRRLRIAKGSGRPISEVNRLLEQFRDMQKMMKKMSGGGRMPPGMFGGLP